MLGEGTKATVLLAAMMGLLQSPRLKRLGTSGWIKRVWSGG